MLLAALFLAAFVRGLASPVSSSVPANPIPSPLEIVTASFTSGRCDPTKPRTIFDILYGCLGVIFLCTYLSIHHNIPDQNDTWAKRVLVKIRTTIYAMLAPELVIMWALRQRITAEEIVNSEFGRRHKWTRAHAFFLQMGGLVRRNDKGEYELVVRDWYSEKLRTNLGTDFVQLPVIRKKEIEDRSKGDVLSKTLGVLQISWFVAQCIARRVEGLVLTELELVTLGFAVLNVVTYALWWDKPLNVGYPIYFNQEGKRLDGPEEQEEEAWYEALWKVMTGKWGGDIDSHKEEEPISSSGVRQNVEQSNVMEMVWEKGIKKPLTAIFGPFLEMTNMQWTIYNRPTSVHPFYASEIHYTEHSLSYLCASVVGTVFGGIHLTGWNFPFLTVTELWLWRASSLVITAIPAFIALLWPTKVWWWDANSDHRPIARTLWILITYIGTPLYIAARISILFLALFSLRDLPELAYKGVKWSNFIPHL
ncbi:hypothetical protein AX16_005762 [Volvariella volvacea WC 439]|nr:hypothetical protein AX16_005762 [Volvariella volvacea WC 439]